VINTTNIKDSTELKEKQIQLPVSLRDYMAAKAIEGASVSAISNIRCNPDLLAADAYALADAMLKAREA
jgi:hypothetical protein